MEQGDELRQLIEASGEDKQDVARALGVAPSTITHYIQKQRRVPDGFMDRAKPYLLWKAEERVRTIKATVQAHK